jgi:hypothetical protein
MIKLLHFGATLLLCFVTSLSTIAQAQTLRLKPLSKTDDAEQLLNNNSVNLYSTDLELGGYDWQASTKQITGIRFPNVNLPQGSTISKAYIQFAVDELYANTSNTANITIKAQKGDAATYAATTNNISSRTYTTANATWATQAWTVLDQRTATQQTPDLSALIKEAIQTGWASGNAIAFSFSTATNGYATAWALDRANSANYIPELVIEYTVTQPPTGGGKLTNVFINEATGSNTLNNTFDWVEVFNNNANAVNLDSVFLSDSKKKPLKYRFSGKTLAAKAFISVNADGDLTASTATTAAFGIGASGETIYMHQVLNGVTYLLDSLAIGATQYNTSYGRVTDGSATVVGFKAPTQGASNNNAKQLLPLSFSNDRGIYVGPFALTLTAPTGSTIKYTTNFTTPSVSNGTVYANPIYISANSVIKAIAYNTAGESQVVTHTYIFPSATAQQLGIAAADVETALKELPIVTLNTPNNLGSTTELTGTFEYINKFGENKSTYADAGYAVFGFTSTQNPKKSYRIYFRKAYGYSKLKHKVFKKQSYENYDPTDEFDGLDLKASSEPISYLNLADYLAHNAVRKMGTKDVHVQMVNVFVNGQYNGVYPMREKFDDNYAASYYGGKDNNYDYLKSDDIWYDWPTVMKAELGKGSGTDAQWRAVVAAADSRDFQNLKKRLDMQTYVDNMLMFLAGGAEPEYKAVIGQNFTPKMIMYMKDLDAYMTEEPISGGHIGYKHNLSKNAQGPNGLMKMSGIAGNTPNIEYQTFVKDRFENAYINANGAMNANILRSDLRTAQTLISNSEKLEIARWKYFNFTTWNNRVDAVFNNLPTRINDVISYFRQYNLVHTLKAVSFSKPAGQITEGEAIFITNPNPNINVYYTLDSSEVVLDNAVSPKAKLYNATTGIILPTGKYKIRARAMANNNYGMFSDIEYTVGTGLANPIANVTNLNATPTDTYVTLNWTLPAAGSFDDIIIIAKEGFPVIGKPDAAANYFADANFTSTTSSAYDGGKVVYKGNTANSINITNLTKGKTYYFRVFTRKGTGFSDGAEVSATISDAVCNASGQLLVEMWNNIGATNCVSNIPVNTAPTSRQIKALGLFESPTNQADNFGARYRGYICAPETGNYTFYIAADDGGEFYLSSDENPANKRLVAQVPYCSWALPREWTKYPEQKSAVISLVAGRKYYVEALYKEGIGGDNLAIGWLKPSNPNTIEVVSGTLLSPYVIPAGQSRLDITPVFTADMYKDGQKAVINWITNANYKADYYVIEKMALDKGVFETVETVDAEYTKTEVLHTYTFMDKNPARAEILYRVGMVKVDNSQIEYTNPVLLDFSKFTDFHVYPNPAQEVAYIDLADVKAEYATVRVVNNVGKTLLQQNVSNAKGSIRLDVETLDAGQYVVYLEIKGKKAVTRKLTIMK